MNKNLLEEMAAGRAELELKINELVLDFERRYEKVVYCIIKPGIPVIFENTEAIYLFPVSAGDKIWDSRRCIIELSIKGGLD